MKLALLFLLSTAAASSVVLTDDVFQIPADEWRWVRFDVRQRAATVACRFETVGGGEARAELVSRSELERFREHKQHDALASTDPGHQGTLSHYIDEAGEYAVVIENAGERPAAVHLNVGLDFAAPRPVSRSLSPERQLTVIVVSFAMFFAIVTFSARALLRAMKSR
ncbi:MAG TPA: hypothetical protein VGL72_22055 [Bryobacteraceae bacterium]|jgi:hypothetical protein